MDFSLTDEERMLIEMAGQFADGELAKPMRDHEAAGSLPAALREAFEQTGIPMLGAPQVDPEMPVSWAARAQAIQRLAQADGAATLQLWRAAWLPAMAALMGCKTAPHALVLVQDRARMSWPLPCLPMGGGDRIVVLDQSGSFGLAQVEATEVRALGLSAAGPAACDFVAWLEEGQADEEAAAAVRASARLWGASILAGISRASLAHAAAYVQERISFGKPLSNHQGVAFMIADMVMRVEGMDAQCIHAAWMAESGQVAPCTDAWLECIEAGLYVTNHAVQLLGGHGYTRDHPVEKWMRDVRALTLLWGGRDLAMDDAASREL